MGTWQKSSQFILRYFGCALRESEGNLFSYFLFFKPKTALKLKRVSFTGVTQLGQKVTFAFVRK